MATRAQIVTEARRWLGTPFKHQGRIIGEGVDCVGVLIAIAYRFDYAGGYEDPCDYPAQPHTDYMERMLNHYLEPVRRVDRQPADILTFAFKRNLQHVAILVEPDRILHAWNRGKNAIVDESRLTGKYIDAMRRCYKFRGLE